MRLEFSLHVFEKYSNINLNENPFCRNGVVPSELAERRTDRQTGMTKLIVTFRNVAYTPNQIIYFYYLLTYLLHGTESFLRS